MASESFWPRDLHIHTRGEVIVIFNDARDDAKGEWTAAQEGGAPHRLGQSARRRSMTSFEPSSVVLVNFRLPT